jgi:hypothetical protein
MGFRAKSIVTSSRFQSSVPHVAQLQTNNLNSLALRRCHSAEIANCITDDYFQFAVRVTFGKLPDLVHGSDAGVGSRCRSIAQIRLDDRFKQVSS